MTAALYTGPVIHRRLSAPRNRFRYEVFCTLLDLDQTDSTLAGLRLFSHNRFNLFSFYERDHGPADGSSLRDWADAMTDRAGLPQAEQWLLLSMPRVLGYTFNPLSLWYARRNGKLFAVIAEVRNTFGGRHAYLLHDQGKPLASPVCDKHNKVFPVSPFQPMDLSYEFRLSEPGADFLSVIRCKRKGDTVFTAVQQGVQQALTDRNLLRQFFRLPWLTLKVTGLIHWQALKLWLRGAPYYRHTQTNPKEPRP
ncbi:DUF1365 domain-containing protein [Granulosicoccaceae sp. 1_MG-2023]|nr:DUF1365 domain-containing protein [Granulosicoccaceae sp. 1_MG-2023]